MALLALFIALPSLKAGNVQVYNTGDIPNSAGSFTAPDFFDGAGWTYKSRSLDPAKKDTVFFPDVLGVTDGVAYGIEISKTEEDPGNVFLSLNLPFCDSIYVEGWGTGGRGILITNDVNTDSTWLGASSYNLMRVSAKLGMDAPVVVKITPTSSSGKNTYSNGGTWITRIVVFANEVSEVTDLFVTNPGFESANSTLLVNTNNNGVWIPEGWAVDYPTTDVYDQGLVSSGQDGTANVLPLSAQEGTQFYYARLRWSANHLTLKQALNGMPAGYNEVSFKVASPNGHKAILGVATNIDTVTASPSGGGWENIDLVFVVEEGSPVLISATANSPTVAENRMYLDDVRLVASGTSFPPSVLNQ
jgi:hypothetical protein